jgi:hypothetical protein
MSTSLINANGNLKLSSELNTPSVSTVMGATFNNEIIAPAGITGSTGSFDYIRGTTGSILYLDVSNITVNGSLFSESNDAGNTAKIDQGRNVFITNSDITGAGPYTYKFNAPPTTPSVRTAHFMCPNASAASICGLGINGNVLAFQNAIYLDASSNSLYVGTSQNGGGGYNLARQACWYDISNNIINPFDQKTSSGFISAPNAFAADDTYVYLGGAWNGTINGVTNTKYSAKILKSTINTSTPSWYAIDSDGASSGSTINALYLNSTSTLYSGNSSGSLFKTTDVKRTDTPGSNTSQVANVHNRTSEASGVINTLVPNNSDKLLIGGVFTFAQASSSTSRTNSYRANNIAVYDMLNNTISSLGKTSESDINAGVDGTVLAIYVDSTAAVPTIYVGGLFTSGDMNVRARNIVKIENYLTSNITYTALDIGVDSTVYAITRVGQQLYVGGNFSSVGSANMHSRYLAIWDLTLNKWISTGHAFSSSIYSIVHNPAKNVLYIGGAFTIGGGVYNPLIQLDLSKGLTLQDSNGNAFYKMIGTAGMTKPNIGATEQCKFITDADGSINVCNLFF